MTPRHHALWAHVQATFAQKPLDLSHDAEHILRVYRWAVRLAPEAGVDPELAGAAALVHDLVQVPKESADRALGGERSAAAGAEILPRVGYSADETAQVVEAVRTCSWSRGLAPTLPLGAVLQDADRLDAIGAVGIARNFACAQGMASRSGQGRLFNPADPAARQERPLDDRHDAADHYRAKLLRLAAGMHTPTARAEAARRHETMRAFLDALAREEGGTPG